MKKLVLTLCAGIFALALSTGDAEAKRLGGARSSGLQRDTVTQKQAAPAQPAAPTQQNTATPAAAPQPAVPPATPPKRNWLGPIAGLAAGLGIAALLSHFGLGEGVANFLMLALLALAAVFVVRLLFARKRAPAATAEPMQYAGVGGPALAPMPAPAELASSGTATTPPAGGQLPARNIPADFDGDAFLRVAKLNFIRLQAANDTCNIADLREFLTPELFAEVKMQIDERGVEQQTTDVVTLNAELLEFVTEGHRHIASVRFSGMMREDAGGIAAPFDEVWNLVKPAAGGHGWQVGGIQQLS
ncbi:MAG: Tim44 domain-containing protein [Rhodocyclales bacterium]|nr:Tim44 domain-containing protein [Rhodocyclales bacterium]